MLLTKTIYLLHFLFPSPPRPPPCTLDKGIQAFMQTLESTGEDE